MTTLETPIAATEGSAGAGLPAAYARDSSAAALALLGLLIYADGELHPAEVQTLQRMGLAAHVGLDEAAMLHGIEAMHSAAGALRGDDGRPCLAHWQCWLELLRDPALQRLVLSVGLASCMADGHLSQLESKLLVRAGEFWRQEPEPLLAVRPELGLKLLEQRGAQAQQRQRQLPRWLLPG
jgi:uncharacterized tellurite resistance protein B-like protein